MERVGTADPHKDEQTWTATRRRPPDIEWNLVRAENGVCVGRYAARIWVSQYVLATVESVVRRRNVGTYLAHTLECAGSSRKIGVGTRLFRWQFCAC